MPTNYNSWMTDKYSNIPLNQLALPGSHDAGMYKIEWSTNIASLPLLVDAEDNAQTQSKHIIDQLQAGIRYFDIRPGKFIDGDDITYRAGHFYQSDTWGTVGSTGCKLDSILDDVVKFMGKCGQNEVVILKFSHYFQVTTQSWGVDNTLYDDGNHDSTFNPIKQYIVNHVNDMLQVTDPHDSTNTIHYLYKNDDGKRLTEYTPNELSGSGNHAKVIAIFDGINSSITMPARCYTFADMVPDSGNHPNDVLISPNLPAGDFVLYDCFSNTDDYHIMSSPTDTRGQLFKFSVDSYHSGDLYLFSWTLTLGGMDHLDDKISDLAATANSNLAGVISNMISDSQIYLVDNQNRRIPNIIYVDYVDTFVTDACIQVNDHLHLIK